jgi:hypothetical protein
VTRRVKRADLIDNFDLLRISSHTARDLARREKDQQAREFLGD